MKFRRWVVFTFLIHVAVIAVDKGAGLILWLINREHASEHGSASIAASLPFILMSVANLGLATSLVYFVRRRRYSAQVAFESTLLVALVWGGIVASGAFVLGCWVLPLFGDEYRVEPLHLLPICLAVPLLLIASYGNSVQLATDRVKDYGIVHLITSVSFLPMFFLVFALQGGRTGAEQTPPAVAWGRLLSTAVVVGAVLFMVRRVIRVRVAAHGDFLRDSLAYGWKANLTSMLTYLNHRVGLFVLPLVLMPLIGKDEARAQVAYFSMAITFAELVWHFPEAMRDLFFSKVASSTHEEARRLTPILSRLGVWISLTGGLLVLWLVDPVMTLISGMFGGKGHLWAQNWSAPVGASLWALMPGTVAYTVAKVLQADLAARNRLGTCVQAQVIVFVVMLAGSMWWIPQHEALGAAWASSLAYLISTAYTLIVYSRSVGVSLFHCLLPARADLRYIVEIAAAVRQKLRRR